MSEDNPAFEEMKRKNQEVDPHKLMKELDDAIDKQSVPPHFSIKDKLRELPCVEKTDCPNKRMLVSLMDQADHCAYEDVLFAA